MTALNNTAGSFRDKWEKHKPLVFAETISNEESIFERFAPKARALVRLGLGPLPAAMDAGAVGSNLDEADLSPLRRFSYLDECPIVSVTPETRPETLANLPAHADNIIYLAQSPHYRDFPAQAEHIWEVNVQGVLRMLEYARKAEAAYFLLASSGSVYAPSTVDFYEDSPLALGPGQTRKLPLKPELLRILPIVKVNEFDERNL